MIPLSIDLRKRVIEAMDEGTQVDEVAKNFKISRRVIYNWLKLRKTTGSLEPKSGYQKGYGHKITDWESFKVFVEQNKYCTAKEMANKWQDTYNKPISKSSMERALKKIGYTSKKNFQLY